MYYYYSLNFIILHSKKKINFEIYIYKSIYSYISLLYMSYDYNFLR